MKGCAPPVAECSGEEWFGLVRRCSNCSGHYHPKPPGINGIEIESKGVPITHCNEHAKVPLRRRLDT